MIVFLHAQRHPWRDLFTEAIQTQYDLDVLPSWLDVTPEKAAAEPAAQVKGGLYYSYAVCEDDQSFPKSDPGALYNNLNTAVTLVSFSKYTEKTCPYKVEPTGCECWNNNDALDRGSYPGPNANTTWRQVSFCVCACLLMTGL